MKFRPQKEVRNMWRMVRHYRRMAAAALLAVPLSVAAVSVVHAFPINGDPSNYTGSLCEAVCEYFGFIGRGCENCENGLVDL